jgi:hypothetical protein
MKQNKLFKQLEKKVKSIVEDHKHSVIFNKYPDDIFKDVKYYVMFIGYAHSGHSLIGALLDAHPNMIISNELHALPLFANYNYDKYKIFKLILDNSIRCAAIKDRTNTGYNYYIPNLYQGKFEKLEVIGDKKGGATAVHNLKHPEVMDNIIKLCGSSLKIIHVLRNPYDNITAYAYRRKGTINKELIENYFSHVDSVLDCKAKLQENQFYNLFYEKLVNNKEAELKRLCSFLNQEANPDYLKQCSDSIYDSPRNRRYSIEWKDENKSIVSAYMNSDKYKELLSKYEF